MAYYCNNEQEKWLLEQGLIPDSKVKGISLLEAAQWLHKNHQIECSYDVLKNGGVDSNFYYIEDGDWEKTREKTFDTIPEALSWAITEAINHIKTNQAINAKTLK